MLFQTYSSPENALSWNNASNELNAAVIGLELTLPTSETIPVNDINFPIQMALRTCEYLVCIALLLIFKNLDLGTRFHNVYNQR